MYAAVSPLSEVFIVFAVECLGVAGMLLLVSKDPLARVAGGFQCLGAVFVALALFPLGPVAVALLIHLVMLGSIVFIGFLAWRMNKNPQGPGPDSPTPPPAR